MTSGTTAAEKNLKLASLQINTTVGDIAGNLGLIARMWDRAEAQGADLAVTPELSVTGYPLEDLVENPDLLDAAKTGLEKLVEKSKKMASGIIVGLPWRDENGGKPYNAAFLVENGQAKGPVLKRFLPNYDVFDEVRNFQRGGKQAPLDFRGVKIGLMVCEDTWYPDAARDLKEQGAQILVSVNASPFEPNKILHRLMNVAGLRVHETGLPLLYVNQVGGQDEVVFDGGSLALGPDMAHSYLGPMFSESLDIVPVRIAPDGTASLGAGAPNHSIPNRMEQTWQALVAGTRDYLKKIGVREVVLGMSGGIDSALVAAIAADAIGPENVHLISMPYKYTTDDTRNDARIAAQMLGAPFEEIPIADAVEGLRTSLGAYFNPASKGTANENDQARVRGMILMHVSNEKGWLVLSTGNKSEISVGFCTLYGDMSGGFNPLKDVDKELVFALARWRNANVPANVLGPKGPVMPQSIIDRKPSAQLAPNQVDENVLPPYDILCPILHKYVNQQKAVATIADEMREAARPLIESGRYASTEELVDDSIRKTDIAEFKRRQACPGVKISERSFGKGRRIPIARPPLPTMMRTLERLAL